MFFIYHIPTFLHKDGFIGKIGCTHQEPHVRVEKQGYTDFEVLEQHECIYKASDREIELQKQYGYPVDTVPYYVSYNNRRRFNDEDRKKSMKTLKKIGFFDDWYKLGNESRRKGCVALDKETLEPVKEFISVADAARWVNKEGSTSAIIKRIRSGNNIYGYKWKYKD